MIKRINKKIIFIAVSIIFLTASLSYAAYVAYAAGIVFFGGNSNTLVVQTFTTVGTQIWTVPEGVISVELLVVAGGGGGATSQTSSGGGGGGGAGGLRYLSSFAVTAGSDISVAVGAGGAPGTTGLNQNGSNGSNSSFDSVTAIGGGGGGRTGVNGLAGGSGGGGGYNGYSVVKSGGSATSGQGNAGGNTSLLSWAGGAGGGGAGGVGGDNKINHAGGDRGPGLSYSITGSPVTYAIGGGGGANSPAASPANTGKGGDAAYAAGVAYAGGSGVVIVRYRVSQKAQTSSIQSGLIGYWPLDGNNYNAATNVVTDKTPYGHNGTNVGATLTSDRMGQSNGAMSFNGLDSRISISYTNPVKQTSVVAWFKRSGVPAGNYHIITGGSNIEISTNEPGGFIRTGVTTNTLGRQVFNSGSGLIDGNWHQVAFTYDGINIRSFIDGNITATNPASGDLVGTATEIGRYLSNSYVANGSISDVRIYNRALSPDEITTLYNSYKPKIVSDSLQSGLVLDMPLTSSWTKSEVAGSQIMTDKTPYSRDGQNYGGAVGNASTSFDGASDYVQLSSPVRATTLSLWANFNNLTAVQYFIGSSNTRGIRYDGSQFLVYADSGYSLVSWTKQNRMVHFVISRVGATNDYDLYIDGEKIGTANSGTVAFSDLDLIYIGKRNDGYFFNGPISNVKIYNRSLSAVEIKALYDKGQ